MNLYNLQGIFVAIIYVFYSVMFSLAGNFFIKAYKNSFHQYNATHNVLLGIPRLMEQIALSSLVQSTLPKSNLLGLKK